MNLQDIIFSCKVKSNTSSLLIDWQFRNITMDQTKQRAEVKITQEGYFTVSKLHLTNVQRSDNGTYRCRARNIFGLAQSKFVLHVLANNQGRFKIWIIRKTTLNSKVSLKQELKVWLNYFKIFIVLIQILKTF